MRWGDSIQSTFLDEALYCKFVKQLINSHLYIIFHNFTASHDYFYFVTAIAIFIEFTKMPHNSNIRSLILNIIM